MAIKSLKTLVSLLKYSKGNNLLHQFVIDNSKPNSPGNPSYIRAVLRSFSSVSAFARNQDGYTAIHLAIHARNYLVVEELLSCFPEIVNIREKPQNSSPLHCAAVLRFEESELEDKPEYSRKDLIGKAKQEIADIIKLLIKSGADLKAKDFIRYTPLHQAAVSKCWDNMKVLVECGAEVNYQDGLCEETPIHIIVTQNYCSYEEEAFSEEAISDIIEFFIRHGADLNIKNDSGSTPLHKAVMYKCWEVIKALLANGAALNIRYSLLLTPLQIVAEEDFARDREKQITFLIKFLISHGADLNIQDDSGATPLHIAAMYKCWEMMNALVAYGAALNIGDSLLRTPLHIAAEEDFKKEREKQIPLFIKFLVSNGADINAKDHCGNTPLHKAVKKKNWETVKALVENAVLDCKDELRKIAAVLDCKDKELRTPLHIAVELVELSSYNRVTTGWRETVQQETSDIIKFLISSGADVNAKAKNGETPLHRAVTAECFVAVKTLVESGAIVDCKDENLCTPLHVAVEIDRWGYNTECHARVQQEATNIVTFLISSGADVNTKDDEGETPLHKAVKSKFLEGVKALVENGAVVDCRTKYLDTPLHFAAKHEVRKRCSDEFYAGEEQEIPNIIKFLISSGADLNAKEVWGRTPLDEAVERNNWRAVAVLEDSGAVGSFNKERSVTALLMALPSEAKLYWEIEGPPI